MRKIIKNVFIFMLLSFFFFPKSVFSESLLPVKVTLANGFKITLIQNRSIPVIASVVTVHSGSSNETFDISGTSHMLEHMLFNGTKKRSQEELYSESDFYGIYNNAHTGKDFTNFIILTEKENIEKALDIQSDMLFNSTIPNKKFEKEKGIILNEFTGNSSNSSFIIQSNFDRVFLRGTPYNLPVLGTPKTIKNLNRDNVFSFYKKYYAPNNMTQIVMGNFDIDSMFKLLEKYYGNIAPKKTYRKDISLKVKPDDTKKNVLNVNIKNPNITLGKIIPHFDNDNFYALSLFSKLLNIDLKDKLNEKNKGGNIIEAWSDVDFNRDFSYFKISVTYSYTLKEQDVENSIKEVLEEFLTKPIDEKKVDDIILSMRVDDISLLEKPHYYGMINGKSIATGGFDFTFSFLDKLEKNKKNIKNAALKYFSNADFFKASVSPGKKNITDLFVDFKDEYFNKKTHDKVDVRSLKLLEIWNKEGYKSIIKSPLNNKIDQSAKPLTTHPVKVNLENGLTVIVNSNPYSKVFAIHTLFKNRSLMEPDGMSGIAELLHRVLKKGTKDLDKVQLNSKIGAIGGKLKTYDNPYMPYDDYYSNNDFSFIRFETIDLFAYKAIDIVSTLIKNPRFNDLEINEAKKELINLITTNNLKPAFVAKKVFKENILYGSPLGNSILGSSNSIKSINKKDIENFHKDYFSLKNMIISVSTSLPSKEIIKKLNKNFLGLSKRDIKVKGIDLKQIVSKKQDKLSEIINKDQSVIKIGKTFEVEDEDKLPLVIASSFISGRLNSYLRETMGLSYSVWAYIKFYGRLGILEASAGTTKDSIEKVKKGIYSILGNQTDLKIKSEELGKVRNKKIFKGIMRRLSRMSQSYYLGVSEFYYNDFNYYTNYFDSLKKVTPDQVKKVLRKYINNDNLLTVIVE